MALRTKPRKNDIIISWDPERKPGRINSVSRGVAYTRYPDTTPGTFDVVFVECLEPIPNHLAVKIDMRGERLANTNVQFWQERA